MLWRFIEENIRMTAFVCVLTEVYETIAVGLMDLRRTFLVLVKVLFIKGLCLMNNIRFSLTTLLSLLLLLLLVMETNTTFDINNAFIDII